MTKLLRYGINKDEEGREPTQLEEMDREFVESEDQAKRSQNQSHLWRVPRDQTGLDSKGSVEDERPRAFQVCRRIWVQRVAEYRQMNCDCECQQHQERRVLPDCEPN